MPTAPPQPARGVDPAAGHDAPSSGWRLDRVADALPGWLFCSCGAVLLAAVALTPAWLDHHESAWRLKVMQAQARALHEQTQRYERFADALSEDDPVVLERLAMTHLRMAVQGKAPLRPVEVTEDSADVGVWLALRQPEVGRDLPPYRRPESRFIRLVTGTGRPAMLGVSLLLLVCGVLFNPDSRARAAERTAAPPMPASTPVRKASTALRTGAA